jgi:hypothetical protein
MKRYHLELILSSVSTCYHLGLHVIIWDSMLSSGAYVIICDKMLSSGANVIMVSSGANVIIWCYHVMLSSGMITHPFFIFPENFTYSRKRRCLVWGEHVNKKLLHPLSLTVSYSRQSCRLSAINDVGSRFSITNIYANLQSKSERLEKLCKGPMPNRFMKKIEKFVSLPCPFNHRTRGQKIKKKSAISLFVFKVL